ncbi:MAG: NAD(+)/NADH kinase [Alphaproteobacteria bacterium]
MARHPRGIWGSILAVREEVGDLIACRREAFKADVIIVLGGDGTARAAAEAFSAGPPLILLRAGRSMLPHALYGVRTWQDALRERSRAGASSVWLAARRTTRSSSWPPSFGPPTLLARARESVARAGSSEAIRRFDHAFRRMFSRSMTVHAQGSALAHVEGLGVLCPAYVGEIQDSSLEWVQLAVSRERNSPRRLALRDWRVAG